MRTIQIVLLTAGTLWAQPKFEVVSIKACTSPTPGGEGRVNGVPGRLSLECVSLDSLIRGAYLSFKDGVPWARNARTGATVRPVTLGQLGQDMKGSAGWVKTDKWTIDAKADSPSSVEMMRGPMMRAVLAARFKLKIHTEDRVVPVYELMVDKGGPKLKAMTAGSCVILTGPPAPRKPGAPPPPAFCGGTRVSPNGGVDMAGMTMADLCVRLSLPLERDVVDKTGLSGEYDLHLDVGMNEMLAPRPGAVSVAATEASDAGGGSIATALRKVGLRLQPSKVAMEFLAIDHVERPVGN